MTRPEPPAIVDWLMARQRFGVQLGLGRMRELVEALGRPDRAYRSVLVGGTNGKGSTATVVAASLRAGGERVGLTTSPHLQRLSERVVVDGGAVDDDVLAGALTRVRPHAERLGATFFETITASAMLLFAQAGVTTAVLEVGLGGRFDATNVVEPALSLVTGVSLDHTGVLGSSLREIAHEKAGILRPGGKAWTAAEGEALALLLEEAAVCGAELHSLIHEVEVVVEDRGWDGLGLMLSSERGKLSVTTPLVGAHQARNVALALTAATALGVPAAAAVRGAALARWPGRLERFGFRDVQLVLDGAHNPEAAAALARAVRALEGRVPVLVLGVSEDKDVRGVVEALAPVAERIVVTRASTSPRALPPHDLARVMSEVLEAGADRRVPVVDAAVIAQRAAEDRGQPPLSGVVPEVIVEPDPARALERATGIAGVGGTVVVAGSLFLVGEVRVLALGGSPEGAERWQ